VAYFRRDPRIAGLLDRYQFRADLGDFLVYERIPEAQARAESPPTVQPATRDIVQAGSAGGAHARIRDTVFALALLVFVVSAIIASVAEKGRASAPATPESARA
jgi:hypothetical protein